MHFRDGKQEMTGVDELLVCPLQNDSRLSII